MRIHKNFSHILYQGLEQIVSKQPKIMCKKKDASDSKICMIFAIRLNVDWIILLTH